MKLFSRLLTREQLMKMLDVSRSTLLRWEKKGYLKPIKIKGSYKTYYDYEEVETFLKSMKKQ